ncbi:hypothetical protein ACP275_12G005100 [Erythranthe tilingii]
MQYLFGENGKRYLDAFAGIVTVSCGHCHPDILNAINEQSKLLQHATTIYLHHAIGDFAEGLASKMPGNLKEKLLDLLPRLQGVGGAVELAPGYLKLVYDIVRKAGGVCIADEVQTGFGRTGSHYWGFETQGVVPDIVIMAKGSFSAILSTFIISSFTWDKIIC